MRAASRPDGSGKVESLASFVTNPAGSAIVNAIGPIRQIVRGEGPDDRRYLAIMRAEGSTLASPAQIQSGP